MAQDTYLPLHEFSPPSPTPLNVILPDILTVEREKERHKKKEGRWGCIVSEEVLYRLLT